MGKLELPRRPEFDFEWYYENAPMATLAHYAEQVAQSIGLPELANEFKEVARTSYAYYFFGKQITDKLYGPVIKEKWTIKGGKRIRTKVRAKTLGQKALAETWRAEGFHDAADKLAIPPKEPPTNYGDKGLIGIMAIAWDHFGLKVYTAEGLDKNGEPRLTDFQRTCNQLVMLIDPTRGKPPGRHQYRLVEADWKARKNNT